jgi:hypothetical protein
MIGRLMLAIAASLMATAVAHAQCPAVGQGGQQFVVVEDFQPDPIVQSVTAGGDIDLGRCNGVPGRGWVTRLPDFVINYRTRSGRFSKNNLTFRIESSADTVLLVNDPNNRWYFNDDGGKGFNARLTFRNAADGRYDIWIGSYNRGQLPPARLIITELE